MIRINSSDRNEFVSLCEELDTSAPRELRKFILIFIKKHKPIVSNTKEEVMTANNKKLKKEIKARAKKVTLHESKLSKLKRKLKKAIK